jgi:extradiol dioxygenase family protein
MKTPFHFSIGVKSVEDSVVFFSEVLGGRVTHRDDSGYINMSLQEFNDLSNRVMTNAPDRIQMKPQIVDGGTELERKKMYLKFPTGYLIELKGYNFGRKGQV